MVQQRDYNMVEEIQRLGSLLGVEQVDVGMDEERMEVYLKDGQSRLNGLATVTMNIALRSNTGKQLLGRNLPEEVLINQWLEFRTLIDRCSNPVDLETNLNTLNQYLRNKAYLVGNRLTLADVTLYFGLQPICKNISFQEKEGLSHLSRWFDLIQNSSLLDGQLDKIVFSKMLLYAAGSKKH